jgi:oligosaccharide repeat unit polymerase
VNYPLSVCSLIHFLGSNRLRWFSATGFLLPFAQGYLTMSRNSMAIPVATALLVWIYLRGWRTLNRQLLIWSTRILGIIVVYFIGVGAWFGKLASSDTSAYSQEDFNVRSQIAMQFVDPYIYATADFPTLQAAMADVHGHLWGVRTLFPIARLVYALGLLRERPENASLEFYFVPIPSNATTYLFSVYEDFGAVGIVVFPFLFGLAATKVYLRMREAPSIVLVGGAAAFMVVVLYSVFIALGSTILVWSYVCVLYVISRLCVLRDAPSWFSESLTPPVRISARGMVR